MTRTVEQIEADLAAVRRDHQEAVEIHRVAKVVADDLRGRAMAGDTSVTAAALAEAEHAAEFAELPIPAKFGAIASIEAELKQAKTEGYADDFTATVTPFWPVSSRPWPSTGASTTNSTIHGMRSWPTSTRQRSRCRDWGW